MIIVEANDDKRKVGDMKSTKPHRHYLRCSSYMNDRVLDAAVVMM